jgi:dihydroorotate dehydrogenase (NAD+) catalytic subunit
MVDLSVEFNGVKFDNPIVLASGVLGVTGDGMAEVVRNGAGGVTTKSLWPREHKGHPNPVIIAEGNYMLNAVGIPDAGPAKAVEELTRFREKVDGDGADEKLSGRLIANIVGASVEDYVEMARVVAGAAEGMGDFPRPDVVEVNISCPNVEDELGKPMACSTVKSAEVTRLVKEALCEAGLEDVPMVVKLSPNVENIVAIARGVMEAGADGVTAINTVGPGMAIDIDMVRPVLANGVGGLSGPAIKPLAVKAVHDIYGALKCPIIGTGGVTTGRDAIEMMMAGATLVGVGTAVWLRGQDVFGKIVEEMREWCEENEIEKLSTLIGKIHENS